MRTQRLWIVFLALFFIVGCFTESYMAKDEMLPEDKTVRFHLTSGEQIRSAAGRHPRVEGGYQVVGEFVKGHEIREDFEGIVLDQAIDYITMQEFNTAGTIGLLAGLSFVVVLLLLAKPFTISI